MTNARIRGIYATALTAYLDQSGITVAQPSESIRERFADVEFEDAPADVMIRSTGDRLGIEVSGEPSDVDRIAERIASTGTDALRLTEPTPREGIFVGRVTSTRGSGAVVSLGDGVNGFLPYDDIDSFIETGDRYRLQVHDPIAPWRSKRSLLGTDIEVRTGLFRLKRNASGVTTEASGPVADELLGMTELLSIEPPDGWAMTWLRGAVEASTDELEATAALAFDRATRIDAALSNSEESEDPTCLCDPLVTEWIRFGHESRTHLDELRRSVVPTITGHHRIKAIGSQASVGVDLAESIIEPDGSEPFPFDAISRHLGPSTGDTVSIHHVKPDGHRIDLGTATVTDCDGDGSVTVERTMSGGGRYDALEVAKESGDVAITNLREGRWWYPTTYRGDDGFVKGTYVNVCTPIEIFPHAIEYVDLYVDVVRDGDDGARIVDTEELNEARQSGLLTDDLAEKALTVASAVRDAMGSAEE